MLHLLEQGATARLRAGRICVELDGHALGEVPARKVRQVALHGNVRLTTPALQFFLGNGVPVLYVSLKGALHGVASSCALAPPARLRAQFAAATSAVGAGIAQLFVLAKLRSSLAVLTAFRRTRPELAAAAAQLHALGGKVAACTELERLRGFEGLCARLYYAALQRPLAAYGFTGRNRRPPRDPVNAALSYGYALLLAQVQLATLSAGLHPEVGLLHAESRRNPAMSLDLMEEFRVPVVDLTVFRAFLSGALHPTQHFRDEAGGIYLSDAGRKVLVPLLEARLDAEAKPPEGGACPYRTLIERQARRLAAALEGRRPYSPFYLSARPT
ncbi:CRISPR-associated endonuclease Cas1 [Truepera radiovictrix]|uniref:CRISPR-associated endonuclease Cas1 n=1 Tax=Truepera radiovictrix TaxID=332249 RepID=UPI00031B48C0|nr:CRISPR-associated endonuclease Cas1 [Truepera radiovictrix]WMT57871.1 CRISPR-associated endonuclease Cas1 [Truepera radiovictrix]